METHEPRGELVGDGVACSDLAKSGRGGRLGLIFGVAASVLLGLFSMLRGFFFSDELGIQVRIRVGPLP